jgi:hypothetical protein
LHAVRHAYYRKWWRTKKDPGQYVAGVFFLYCRYFSSGSDLAYKGRLPESQDNPTAL